MQVLFVISVSKMAGVWTAGPQAASLPLRQSRPFICPAAILGMHTLMSNQQYYQALGSSSIVNKEGLNSEYMPQTTWHPP
jgi:hypothetical protein